MSFSATTCLTNNGSTELGPTLYFYSNIDNYLTSFGSESTENLFSGNCPYIMENIPDGTTTVRIIDPLTNCCVDIILQSSDLCNICNLTFDTYQTQTVSQIVAGNLVGSCDDNISDYIINWYGPGEGSTNLAFTSGYGTEFANIGWDNTHPLTGSSSPLIQAGVYTPVIDRVIVNDVVYSTTGAPGTYVANLNCFDSQQVIVEPLRCDNGNFGGAYSHHYFFSNVSVNSPADSLSATFVLSSNTNYLAWQFKGLQRYDTLKMTFYGSEYGNIPLIIENVRIGSDAGTSNVGVNTNPKIIGVAGYIKKVTCLTGLTINENDYIIIEITPNISFNTQWDFYFTCLETFNCETCYDQFQNSSPKIDLSSVEFNLLPCNKVEILMQISGCSNEQLINTDIGKYFYTDFTPNTVWRPSNTIFDQGSYTFYNETCNQELCLFVGDLCGSSGGTYTFTKSIVGTEGFIEFEFNLLLDLQHYYSTYLYVMNCLGEVVSDNTQLEYYKFFNLVVPVPSDVNEQCGDTTSFQEYTLHNSSIVTTGGTGPFYMTVTMPTIVSNIDFDSCTPTCVNFVTNNVDLVNFSSLSPSTNLDFTTNTGSKVNYPFKKGKYATLGNTTFTANTIWDYITNWQFQNETYVYSGNNVLVSSLTGRTCPYKGDIEQGTIYALGGFGYVQYSGAWRLELTDENDITSFKVLVAPITNWIPAHTGGSFQNYNFNFNTTALTYTNGSLTYSNPDYTY